MNIFINGVKAALKKGSTIEYHSENRLFMGRDAYTLGISFPLRHCPENRRIFGYISRKDAYKTKKDYECVITSGNISLFGSLVIAKVSDVEVECQFVEGRCTQIALDPFEDTYITDLDLGEYPVLNADESTPSQSWLSIDAGATAVALPWINENYPTAPNNWVKYENGAYSWNADVNMLSWQPYLLVIAKNICKAIGYEYDFKEWEESGFRHLIVCNTLPASWVYPQYNKAMPKWTVSEFFEKLEMLLCAEFDFDHKAKSVSMHFTMSVLSEIEPVQLNDIVDSYAVEMSESGDTNCEYICAKRLLYKEGGHSLDNYYSCDWKVFDGADALIYPDLATLIERNRKKILSGNRVYWGEQIEGYRGSTGGSVNLLLYAQKEDTYFVFRSIGVEQTGQRFDGNPVYSQVYVLQSVNVFGSGKKQSDDISEEEIEFVPVCLLDTYISPDDDQGFMMAMKPSSSYSSSSMVSIDDSGETSRPGGMGQGSGVIAYDSSVIHQPHAAASIEAGSSNTDSEYYNLIYIAFWDGNIPEKGKTPYPVIDRVHVSQDWKIIENPEFDIRLYKNSKSSFMDSLPQINPDQKFKFSWLGSSIPNPRAVFFIKGQRYICEKITATFTENGMSQLLKGEFYPIV